MGASQRRKGACGQSRFANLLRERDWTVDPITCGVRREDLLATDPDGRQWSVEVKNQKTITPAHRTQAQEQARARGLPWLLASHIHGTSSWLVQRQGDRPVTWNEREDHA